MKCKKCRKEIPDGSKFCNHCGTPQTGRQKLYRRKDGLYEKIMTIDGKRVAFRAKKEADVFKKIREYEEKKERGELFEDVAERICELYMHLIGINPMPTRSKKSKNISKTAI